MFVITYAVIFILWEFFVFLEISRFTEKNRDAFLFGQKNLMIHHTFRSSFVFGHQVPRIEYPNHQLVFLIKAIYMSETSHFKSKPVGNFWGNKPNELLI
jgi:hypothetical protein